jgi:hypothetical protein
VTTDQLLAELIKQVTRIAVVLEKQANNGQPTEPGLERPLADYKSFDWSTIGASIVNQDPDGPTHVEYDGVIWTRRSPSNKFDPCIWYSRPHGHDDEGKVKYMTLIKFKTIKDAEGIPNKIKDQAGTPAPARPTQQATPPPAARQPAGPAPAAKAPAQAPVTPAEFKGSTTPPPAGPAPQRTAVQPSLDGKPTTVIPPKPGLTSVSEYKLIARQLGINEQGALYVAEKICKCEPGQDYSEAVPTLHFFGLAKKKGLDLEQAVRVFGEAKYNPATAAAKLEAAAVV